MLQVMFVWVDILRTHTRVGNHEKAVGPHYVARRKFSSARLFGLAVSQRTHTIH